MNTIGGKDRKEDIQPIFVVGRGHSGTTILYNMLALHPDLAWFSQYSQRDGATPERFYLPFHAAVNRFLRTLFKHDWRKSRRFWDCFVPNPREARRIWDHILFEAKHDSDANQSVVRLRDAVRKEAGQWHRDKIIFKNPLISTEIKLLYEGFPNAIFVHIIRDGRAVALSVSHKGKHRGKWVGDKQALLCQKAEDWQEVVTKVCCGGEDIENYIEIRYEDFCSDVHGYIAQILDLADLDKERMPWHRLPAVLTPTNDKWLKNCPDQDVVVLEEILGDTLRELGYEVRKDQESPGGSGDPAASYR